MRSRAISVWLRKQWYLGWQLPALPIQAISSPSKASTNILSRLHIMSGKQRPQLLCSESSVKVFGYRLAVSWKAAAGRWRGAVCNVRPGHTQRPARRTKRRPAWHASRAVQAHSQPIVVEVPLGLHTLIQRMITLACVHRVKGSVHSMPGQHISTHSGTQPPQNSTRAR